MTTSNLTDLRAAATPDPMKRGSLRKSAQLGRMMGLFGVGLALAGCISVEAPAEPIVIELNINIRQEVIYRLAEDAGEAIDENADIF